MSKIDHPDDSIYHRVANCDQAVDRAKRHSVDELLDKIFHEFKSSRIWILRKICETILLKLRKDACLASKESEAHLIS